MNIDIGADGAFALTLPSGRVLSIPNTPHASAFLYQLLYEAANGGPVRKGWIGTFPTQAIADAWLRKAAAARLETAAEEYGIAIEFNI